MKDVSLTTFLHEFDLSSDRYDIQTLKNILSHLHIKTPKKILYDVNTIHFITPYNEVYTYKDISDEMMLDIKLVECFLLGDIQVTENGITSYEIEYFDDNFKIIQKVLVDKTS